MPAARETADRIEDGAPRSGGVKLFLCGDVMTGRGVDQILPHPGDPELFESYLRSALGYVALAEQASGPIRRPVDLAYVWGDALAELDAVRPDARIVNLETAVTRRGTPWPDKQVHYRMHPANVGVLAAARIDCCVLANNHVLDWGHAGLDETLTVLHAHGMRSAGAGRDAAEAAAPAAIALAGKGRVLVFAIAFESSGVPAAWAAGRGQPGVRVFSAASQQVAEDVLAEVRTRKHPGDLIVLSIHWGANWGYDIPCAHRSFARQLIDSGEVDLVHGHSSHHPLGMECYRGKLVLYGCGDFLNDYEGIGGHERYRGDLTFMYFATLDAASGALRQLALHPMQIRRLRLERAGEQDVGWLERRLISEDNRVGLALERTARNTFVLVPR